jgi:hypothetical protein
MRTKRRLQFIEERLTTLESAPENHSRIFHYIFQHVFTEDTNN